jgi:hypothetical protein
VPCSHQEQITGRTVLAPRALIAEQEMQRRIVDVFGQNCCRGSITFVAEGGAVE